MPTKVDTFLENQKQWKQEMTVLREIMLDCGLTEDFKWMHPCYTYQGNNIALIHGFKNYCAILFHKGALLQDAADLLVQQTKHVQAARQLRFTDVAQIHDLQHTIKQYLHEAIEVEKAGLQVAYKKTEEFDVPEELLQKFEEDPALKSAFEKLTPGRQRGYLLYFGSAKQAKTRYARIEKSKSKIFDGKGPNER